MKGEKIDIIKLFKPEYSATKTPKLIQPDRAMHLIIEGQGAPGSPVYQEAITGLYSMAYTIKMGRKSAGKGDYTIGKLEGIYWMADDTELDIKAMDQWQWRLMIRTPEKVAGWPITNDDLKTARARLIEKMRDTGTESVKLDYLEEGPCVQILHIGPYNEEEHSLAALHKFCLENKLQPRGKHHEIYLSDPRRVSPEKLKTILRLPIG